MGRQLCDLLFGKSDPSGAKQGPRLDHVQSKVIDPQLSNTTLSADTSEKTLGLVAAREHKPRARRDVVADRGENVAGIALAKHMHVVEHHHHRMLDRDEGRSKPRERRRP